MLQHAPQHEQSTLTWLASSVHTWYLPAVHVAPMLRSGESGANDEHKPRLRELESLDYGGSHAFMRAGSRFSLLIFRV